MDKKISVISDLDGKKKDYMERMRRQRLMLPREFLCFFNVLRIDDGRKTLKESIMLMQSLDGIGLRQGLHSQYITMILEILNDLICSG